MINLKKLFSLEPFKTVDSLKDISFLKDQKKFPSFIIKIVKNTKIFVIIFLKKLIIVKV